MFFIFSFQPKQDGKSAFAKLGLSTSRSYLIWKIRQAEKGKVPIGPRKSRAGEPKDCKVLPLRMESMLVEQLDNARERLGLKSRMALFRSALHAYLDSQGEGEVAALFAPTPEA